MATSPAAAQFIVGHRGASQDAPENTLASFRLAWEHNADAIEGDFHLTKDGEIVCIHDETTKRTAGAELSVPNSTLDELRQLDVGRWKDAKFAGERIPTLAEVLATIPAGKRIFIEIKCGAEIVPRLSPVLQESKLKPEQTVVISFDEQVIAGVREQIPQIKAYWLAGFKQDKETKEYRPRVDKVFETLAALRPTGLDVQANRDVVDAAFVRRLREQNYEFHVWTVNDPVDARYFRSLGVDSITTDRPRFLRQALEAAEK
jgi:glycerophosphoryl diester phosphodiesterase